MGTAHPDVTRLLKLARSGSRTVVNQLLPVLYDELRRLAQSCLRDERSGHTLQATALVHEAYLRLVRQDSVGFHDRQEFFRAAAQVMRRVLVDHARARGRQKRRGGGEQCSLDLLVEEMETHAGELGALDEALTHLAEHDVRKAELIELRFFAGLSVEEAAKVLGISVRTAERDWTMARAWLRSRLAVGDDPAG